MLSQIKNEREGCPLIARTETHTDRERILALLSPRSTDACVRQVFSDIDEINRLMEYYSFRTPQLADRFADLLEGRYRYEIFAMYETEAGVSLSDTLYDNAWWGSENQRTTEEGVQEWIDKKLELSEFAFNANVSPDNTFLTIFTCGNEKVDADEGARLYFFLHRVD